MILTCEIGLLFVYLVQYKLEQLKRDFNALNKEIGQLRKVWNTQMVRF